METVAIDWTYAISTLIIRFVGIFVVLGVLQVVMQIMGRIFLRLDVRDGEKEEQDEAPSPAASGMTEEEAAAVGMALYLKSQGR